MFLALNAPRTLPPAPQPHRPACFSRSLGSGPRSMLEMMRAHSARYVSVGCNANSSAPGARASPSIVRFVVARSSAQNFVKEQWYHQKPARTTAACRILHGLARRCFGVGRSASAIVLRVFESLQRTLSAGRRQRAST